MISIIFDVYLVEFLDDISEFGSNCPVSVLNRISYVHTYPITSPSLGSTLKSPAISKYEALDLFGRNVIGTFACQVVRCI